MRKSLFVWIKVRVRVKHRINLYIPLLIPLHVLLGAVSYVEDLVSLLAPLGLTGVKIAHRFGNNLDGATEGDISAAISFMPALRKAVRMLIDTPPFTLADIDVETENEIFKVKLALA